MNEPVLVAVDGGVLTITLNRPDKRNAINQAAKALIHDAIVELETNDDLRVGVITGTGPTFCAGMDLSESRAGIQNRLGGADGGFAGFVRYPRTKPVVAAVNGPALGGGFELVLACDLVVAVPTAWFALPEPQRGIIAGGGGALRLTQLLPRAIAREILLANGRLTAEQAERWGLLNRVVPPEALASTARELADAVCVGAPLAIAGTLAISQTIERGLEASAWDVNDAQVRGIRATEDAKEGATAFGEKRAPQWSGR
ncbi:enoyl-CoA hydratase-related protein [Amycolatopsis sp. GM8]|uniref:enoyl-CoA hydratase-related protein n=1 Tax=Amycolatopsis sp. GM8 TaxID=2896530 RepID=UPI001EFFEC3D|nr:enoyl-CoA hydratase-related protein [Amycolatopsis sp. GM8]